MKPRLATHHLCWKRLIAGLLLTGTALCFGATQGNTTTAPDALMLYLADFTVMPNPLVRPDYAAMVAGNLRAQGETATVTVNGKTASTQQIGTTRDAISQLNKDASAQLHTGEYARARDKFNEALTIAKNLADTEAQAAMLNNIGVVDAARGDLPAAIRNTQAARDLYAALAEKRDRPAPTPPAAGNFVDQMKQALQQMKEQVQTQLAGASYKLERALLNLGTLHAYLGQYEEAFKNYNKALALYPNTDAPEGGATVLRTMARAELRMAHPDKARAYSERAARAGNGSMSVLIEMNGIALGKIDAPAVESPIKQPQALAERRLADPQQLARFEEQAFNAERSGQLDAALVARRQSAALAEALGSGDDLRASFAHLQRLHSKLQQPELAIYHGKRAVNEIQKQRSGLATMSRDVRKTFIAESRSVYETLAEGLIDQGRLPEAELALQLLRQGDAAELLTTAGRMPFNSAEQALLNQDAALLVRLRANRDARAGLQARSLSAAFASASPMLGVINPTEGESVQSRKLTVDMLGTQLSGFESAWASGKQKSAYETALGVAFVRLQLETLHKAGSCPAAPPDPREAPLLARAIALQDKMGQGEDVRKAHLATEVLSGTFFGAGLRSVETTAKLPCLLEEASQIEATIARADPAATAALRSGSLAGSLANSIAFSTDDAALLDARRLSLAALPAGSVSIHYLVGEHRLRILLTTPQGRVAREVVVERAALESRIENFGATLQSSGRNPLASARDLYATLIAPIAPELAGARTLQLALDGKLRYLPFAALHDGQQWLVERYALALDTAGTPAMKKAAVPVSAWRAAAFGSSAGSGDLAALPSVPGELRAVVRDENQPSQAALPGIIRQDGAFTAQSLREAIAQHYALIHIASHFALAADDPRDSFLLLGDGTRLTLRAMQQQNYRFDGVELLTLSACKTARDGQNGYGQEIEGLAAFMQNQGAASVVSTLWSVNDTSTAQLMRQLYRALQTEGATKAQALQQAQLTLIRGANPADTMDGAERGARRVSAEPAAPLDAKRPFAHPYYWAPFILTGNWL